MVYISVLSARPEKLGGSLAKRPSQGFSQRHFSVVLSSGLVFANSTKQHATVCSVCMLCLSASWTRPVWSLIKSINVGSHCRWSCAVITLPLPLALIKLLCSLSPKLLLDLILGHMIFNDSSLQEGGSLLNERAVDKGLQQSRCL